MQALTHRIHRALQPPVGYVVWHRWPWPLWKLRGWGILPIGSQSFRFTAIDRPQYVWWAHQTHRRRYEIAIARELSCALRPGDVFFDLGAYVGPYTLLASRLVGPEGRVVAFEPDPDTRAILERNLVANGVNNVTVAPYAVGDHVGTVRFSAGGYGVSHVTESGGIEIRQVTLDSYCTEQNLRPTVMKVDIEGAEAAALRDSLPVRGLRELVLEIHPAALSAQGVDPAVLLDALGSYGHLEGGAYRVFPRPRVAAEQSGSPTA